MNKVSKTLLIIAVVSGIALMAFPLSSVLAQDETPPQSEEKEERSMRWLRRPFFKRNIKMRADLVNRPLDLEQQYTVLIDRYEDTGRGPPQSLGGPAKESHQADEDADQHC